MKIICLKSQNVKRVKAVEIRPNGKSLVIAGDNDQGKSSVLDSIAYAIAGESGICQRPIRDGESNAEITVETDTLLITRTFTPKGGSLKVMPKGGVAIPKPQTFLDDLIGNLSFDPLGFSRMKEAEQSTTLRELVGLDFTQIEAERKKVYDERTLINRDVASQTARIAGKVLQAAPEAEVQVVEIMARKRSAEGVNKGNEAERKKLSNCESNIVLAKNQVDFQNKLIGDLEAQLLRANNELQTAITRENAFKASYAEQSKICNDLVDEELDLFDQEILKANDTNAKVRANQDMRDQQQKLQSLDGQSKALTQRIDGLDRQKEQMLAKANFPLQGLGFSATGGVTFENVPWEQISTAKQLKISTAIAMALNPKLRVMLIRDGSLMDSTSLASMKELADKNDYQLWIERVGDLNGEMPGVIIEDGEVVESTI